MTPGRKEGHSGVKLVVLSIEQQSNILKLPLQFACHPQSKAISVHQSAADVGPVRERDSNKHELVAQRCIDATDKGEKMVFIVPVTMRFAHLSY